MDTKNANNPSTKDNVIAFFFIIILVLGYFLYTYKTELENVKNNGNSRGSEASGTNKNIDFDYKKLCYYLLINEFVKNKMLDKNNIKTYYENNYGKEGDSDLYFIRDNYIPLIKEFAKDMNVSYEKFAFLEKVILDAIKNKEKK